jgi:hypothetical protein
MEWFRNVRQRHYVESFISRAIMFRGGALIMIAL